MITQEKLRPLTTLDVLNNYSIVTTRSFDRNLPPVESQKPLSEPIELAPNLLYRLLPEDVGFDVRDEMIRLIADTNRALEEGRSLDQAVALSAETLEVNLRTHHGEIIMQRPVLPHLNKFGMKNGHLRMVGENGEPVIDAITTKERNGSVLEASMAIEDFLLNAENSSCAVLMNPSGVNGYQGKNGENLSHLNAEVMIFNKDEKGDLKGLTIVVDLVEEQAREIMVRLGVSRDLLGGGSEMERLANIVRNPALLSFPGSDITPFEFILDKILSVRGTQAFELLQRDGKPEIRPIEEVRKDVREFKELFRLTQEEEDYVTQPKQLVLTQRERLGEAVVQQEIIAKIEETILLLTREQLKKTSSIDKTVIYQVIRGIEPRAIRKPFLESDNFDREIAFLKTRAGCPPGRSLSGTGLRGVSLGSVVAVGGSINIRTSGGVLGSGKSEWYCVNCPVCGSEIKCEVKPGEKCPNCPAVRECA